MWDNFVISVLINMGNYKELEVWQESRNLAVEIYNATNSGLFKKDFSFRDQIRRAAISIPSNIAEGEESGFNKLGISFTVGFMVLAMFIGWSSRQNRGVD